MRAARIGIPLCLDDRGRWRPGRDYLYIDRSYADAIERAGGSTVLLPLQRDADSLVAELDGLLLPGGDDLLPDPDRGEVAVDPARLDPAPAAQIAFDTALLDAATLRGLPVLGICYGMQLLARARGGRLVTHLPSQRPEALPHRLGDWNEHHPVEIEPGSRLERILGTRACSVNSLHHQAVDAVGPSQRVSACAADGVVEAIEARADDRFEVGVQWHPEKDAAPEGARLFEAFVEACRARD